MAKDVVELGAHEPSVESVVSRLDRFQDKIKHITVIVEWENGSSDVFYDTKDVSQLCFESVILNKVINNNIFDKEND